MKISRKLRLSAGSMAVGVALASAPAFAQEEDGDVNAQAQEEAQTIVVTGSRIQRPEVEGAAPLIAAVGEDEIERRGFTNVAEALNEVPGFGVPVNGVGDQASFTVGQNFVNLFGIGSQRTLTLVNGRRFVSSNTASNFGGANPGLQVDLNVIPVSLIDRIDVLAVKGATTYGSDAIAGTVNLILKDDFEGVEVSGQYGISDRGDLANVFGSATLGGSFADGRGNLAVNFEYDDQEGLLLNERERTRRGLFFGTSRTEDNAFSQTLYENRRIAAVEENGSPTRAASGGGALPRFGGFTDAAGNILRFDPSGNLVPFDLGNPDGFIVNAEGGDGFNLNDVGQILSDLKRFSTFVIGHYDLTDNIRVFVEANYARNEAVELANQPVYQSALFGSPSNGVGMLLSNPFLNDQARALLLRPGNLADSSGVQTLNFDTDGDGVNDDTRFFLQRAGTDIVGKNPNRSDLDLFRVVSGLDGNLELGDRTWNWNVSYSWGRSESSATSTQLVQQNFLNAIDAVETETGEIVCRVTVDPTTTLNVTGHGRAGGSSASRCVPINLFGKGAPSAEAVDYVTAETIASSENEQHIFNANIGGELFDIFDNPVSINVGFERRSERQSFLPDGFLQEGLGRSVAISPVTGRFNTKEFFGEVFVPVIQPYNDSFINLLELDASIRFIDNSQTGSDTVWSVGGRIGPIPGLVFRGSYTESVRAPAITELFLPEVSVFSFADDPCDQDFINSGQAPATRRANCIADGITDPDNFSSVIDDASQRIRSAGNADLASEKSQSWTVGAIFEPDFIPRLTLTADWVDIKLDDAILSATLTDIMEACYDSTNFPNEQACGFFTRDANGQITDAVTTFLNAATFEFAGLQASARYLVDVGPGTLSLLGRYFYLDKSQRVLNGVLNTFDGEIGDSKHEGQATIGYDVGGTSVAITGRYLSSAVYDNEFAEDQRNISGVGDHFEMDLSLAQEINDKFTVRAIVNNVLDTKPPFPSANTATYNSALLGRRYRIGVSMRF